MRHGKKTKDGEKAMFDKEEDERRKKEEEERKKKMKKNVNRKKLI